MKKYYLYIILLIISVFVSNCFTSGMQINPRVYQNEINPKIDFSPSRIKIKKTLTIVMGERIKNQAILKRGQGKVTIEVMNFKNVIERSLIESFKSSFKNVVIQPRESKKGLNLLLLDAKTSDTADTLDYHFVLINDSLASFWKKYR